MAKAGCSMLNNVSMCTEKTVLRTEFCVRHRLGCLSGLAVECATTRLSVCLISCTGPSPNPGRSEKLGQARTLED